jgi:hypothetical protein
MKTKTINIYEFSELSEEAKQKAVENNRDIVIAHDWSSFVIEEIKKQNSDYFTIENIYFSGFWSQGDGAMFEYSCITEKLYFEAVESLSLPNWKKAILKNGYHSAKGKHRGHYYHEKCCLHDIHIETDNGMQYYKNIERLFYENEDLICDYVIEKYEELCREIYEKLENEYNCQTSDEVIIETIEANNYEFDVDGNII